MPLRDHFLCLQAKRMAGPCWSQLRSPTAPVSLSQIGAVILRRAVCFVCTQRPMFRPLDFITCYTRCCWRRNQNTPWPCVLPDAAAYSLTAALTVISKIPSVKLSQPDAPGGDAVPETSNVLGGTRMMSFAVPDGQNRIQSILQSYYTLDKEQPAHVVCAQLVFESLIVFLLSALPVCIRVAIPVETSQSSADSCSCLVSFSDRTCKMIVLLPKRGRHCRIQNALAQK